MYRRYIIIGVVFFLLVGAYFLFFYDRDNDREYEKCYDSLVERESYEDNLVWVSLSIDEIKEEENYSYIITLDNVISRQNDVKILVVNSNCKKDKIEYFPSFGVVDNKGYSLVLSGEETGEKEVKGVNLTILDSDKIEYLLIYFKGNGIEQFVRIKVSNYLV